jgi:hypothetical protein
MKAGAIAVALAWLVSSAPAAVAQEAIGIDIVEYGIYTAETVTEGIGLNGGKKSATSRNICHLMTTLIVPTRDKLRFGLRYRIKGGKPDQLIDVKRTIEFPDHKNPPASLSTYVAIDQTTRLPVGATWYAGWEMWKTYPGVWTFLLSVDDRKLAEIKFTVVEKDQLRIEVDKDSTCFQAS